MPVDLKELLKRLEDAAKAFDEAELVDASGKLANTICENIATHPQGFVAELKKTVDAFDYKKSEKLCLKLICHLRSRSKAYPFKQSKQILGILRRKRYFKLMSSTADVLLQTGQDELSIHRQYAQALLDQDHLSAALDVLKILETKCIKHKNKSELAEAQGLIGRAYKQMYMDAAEHGKPGVMIRNCLTQAISSYLPVYTKDNDNIWHGVNAVALIERAKRDKISLDKSIPPAKTIAKNILKQIDLKEEPDMWDYASASEACLGLKDYPKALEWIIKYTNDTNPFADAFEYASTLRQFEEVWQLDDNDKEQAKIIFLLKAALLNQEGGSIEIKNTSKSLNIVTEMVADKQFEQILGIDRFNSFLWYKKGLDRASSVAQIFNRNGVGIGTGFLICGADIHESIGQEWVIVTNAHVISNNYGEQSGNPAALASDDVLIRFEAKDPGREYRVKKIIFSSPRTKLDCTIVSLQSTIKHVKPLPIAKHLPILNDNERVYIIGHPRGGTLSYSIDDNLVLDYEKPKIHYRAPTEGGSSGSPVFDDKWDLLGIHHAGGKNMKKLNNKSGTYPANEGLFFQSIRDAIAAKFEK